MTTQPTGEQLKRALAKMLPDEIIYSDEDSGLFWISSTLCNEVLDTELLHLCWLVEHVLPNRLWQQYTQAIGGSIGTDRFTIVHATWQQRTIALAKTLNIEIV